MVKKWFDGRHEESRVHTSINRKSIVKMLVMNFLNNLSVTNWLITANVILFIVFSIFLYFYPGLISFIALKPEDLFHGRNVWTLLTSMFMHASVAHLFVNMFSLAFIGNFFEKVIGRKRFLRFYIISGLIAGLIFAFLAYFFGFGIEARIFGTPDTLAVGASGAIFGILGVLAILTPKARVYLILGPLIAVILSSILSAINASSQISITISYLVNFYFIISIFAMVSFSKKLMKIAFPVEVPFWILPIIAILPLIVISLFIELPIGNTAHLGGLLSGIAFGAYLRDRYKKKVNRLNQMMGVQ